MVTQRRARVNRLIVESAEREAVELDARGEKWAALTIVALLAIIEDLTANDAPQDVAANSWTHGTQGTADEPAKSCPTRLMDGRNEIRCCSNEGHEGDCK